MWALSAVVALPTPPPPGVPQRLGMHEAGGLSAVGPMRGRSCAYCHARGAHRGILGVMTLVHFPQAQDAHPSAHVPPVGAAVEVFFVHRDLAPNSRRGGDG